MFFSVIQEPICDYSISILTVKETYVCAIRKRRGLYGDILWHSKQQAMHILIINYKSILHLLAKFIKFWIHSL